MRHSDFKTTDRSIEVCPITSADVTRVARFLHAQLNGRLTPETWAAAIQPTWQTTSPNHGFMLVSGTTVLGVYVAFYSERRVGEGTEKVCNLAAWCVLDACRAHGLRLLRALLAQEGYSFTDLSPSGNVVPLNVRLNFQHLDTAAVLVPNWPWIGWPQVSIVSDPVRIQASLEGRDLEIYRDHAHAAAAHHLVVLRKGECCYVMFRKDRRKGLPLFASILHVGNPDLFRRVDRHVYSHLLTHFGVMATLVEARVVDRKPRLSVSLRSARPRMFRSSRLLPGQIDYLYSELTCVPW